MTCYTLDARSPATLAEERPAAVIPDPSIVPAEDTNL